MSSVSEYKYLIMLLRSVLEGRELPAQPAPPALPAPPEGCELNALLTIAQRHSVAGMAYYALEKLTLPEGALSEQWRQVRDKALVKDIIQQQELETLGAALSGAGVRFLPLKGSIIKSLYPQSDMRTMSDIDLLIDEKNAEKARDIMAGLGFSCEHFGYDIHDIYYKPPVMNVEIHRALFGEDGREFQKIFADPWSLCRADGARYSFTPDAFFAYVLAHAVKHLEEGGTGIRSIMDLWVCAHSDMGIDAARSLDMLAPSGKSHIAFQMLALSEVWFGDRLPDENTEKLERYIFGSGTYGTVENSAKNRIERAGGRPAYLLRLIFPTFERMREHYPLLKKAPVLLPWCWLVRLVTKPFINRRQNAEKLRTLLKK